jgi:hypothetical protein
LALKAPSKPINRRRNLSSPPKNPGSALILDLIIGQLFFNHKWFVPRWISLSADGLQPALPNVKVEARVVSNELYSSIYKGVFWFDGASPTFGNVKAGSPAAAKRQ